MRSGLMAYGISRDFPLQPVEINTCHQRPQPMSLQKIVLVPILRADWYGEWNLWLIPYRQNCTCGTVSWWKEAHWSLTHIFEKYRRKQGHIVMIVDPMLATGGSAMRHHWHGKETGRLRISPCLSVRSSEGVGPWKKHIRKWISILHGTGWKAR